MASPYAPPLESPTDPNAAIEVDEGRDEEQFDDDGGYVTDSASLGSTSLSSSIRAHIYEGDLRYHSFHDGMYAFPNDETEQNRDDMKHAMTMILCGDRLHFSPIGENPQNIIDLGIQPRRRTMTQAACLHFY